MPYKNIDDKRKRHQVWHKEYYLKNKERIAKKQQLRRERLRIWTRTYKTQSGCICCPEKHWSCLDFHHLDPSNKTDSIKMMVSNVVKFAILKAEVRKCVILCANCHRKLHAGVISLP